MTRSLRALVLIGVPACVLATTGATASATPQSSHPTFPHCLVGSWRDGHEPESTTFNGKKVKLHYSGGDVDHFHSSGVDQDNWNTSHAEHGTYQGSKLTDVIRGMLTIHEHVSGPGKLRVTSGTWSHSSTNTFTYKGHVYQGYLNSLQPFTIRYTCSSKTLKYFNKKGHRIGIETRISRKP